MKIPFEKYQWTWNDFILIDQFNWKLSDLDLSSNTVLVQKMCDRNFWIWSDWIVLIKNWEKEKFRYQMFNPDWSEAEMCWNWIRCYLKFLIENNYCSGSEELKVETLAWILKLKMDWNLVVVDMWAPILESLKIPAKIQKWEIESLNRKFEFRAVSMWNPHCAIFIEEDLNSFDLNSYWKEIESNTDFFPNKVNAEFLNLNSSTEVSMRVFERWAWETLACWTGACASVVAGILDWKLEKWQEIKVRLKGWDLFISWSWNSEDSVIMKWPAEKVFEWNFLTN